MPQREAPPGDAVAVLSTPELGPGGVEELARLCSAAFGPRFDGHDLEHALGGTHLIVRRGGALVAHAAVVPRRLRIGPRTLSCGYLEAVATDPGHQGQGLGRAVVGAAGGVIGAGFDVGALSTGSRGFYERLGWRSWGGPAWVVDGGLWRRTPDEDDAVMVLLPPGGGAWGTRAPIAVEARDGDDW